MKIRLRGIFTIALTKLFLDEGFQLVDPSKDIIEKFVDYRDRFLFDKKEDILITDKADRQGIEIRGSKNYIDKLKERLSVILPDPIFRFKKHNIMQVEFPYGCKSFLDNLRDKVTPTVTNHHRLYIINSSYLDYVEREYIYNNPKDKVRVSKEMLISLIWSRFKEGRKIKIEHVKLDGKIIYLSPGEILNIDPKRRVLLLKRKFYRVGSIYDGLNMKIEEGDYTITILCEGGWYYKHLYFRKNGKHLGTYLNINTPIEFYPDRVRYIDLEVDIIIKGQKRELIDIDKLNSYYNLGYISQFLRNKIFSFLESLLKDQS